MANSTGKSTPDPTRVRAQRRGHRGELLAAWSLRLKGYSIVERRFRTKLGEIDIIARKGDLVAMVEVKARASIDEAVNSVTASAQQRIENAADLWIARQPDFARLSVRFDIVAVVPGKWPCQFKGAW